MKKYRYFIILLMLLLIYCISAFFIRGYTMDIEKEREQEDIGKIELLKDIFQQVVDEGVLDEYIDKHIDDSENIKIDFGNVVNFPNNHLKSWYTEIYNVIGDKVDVISKFNSKRLNNDKDDKNIYVTFNKNKDVKVYISKDSINSIPCEFYDGYFESR